MSANPQRMSAVMWSSLDAFSFKAEMEFRMSSGVVGKREKVDDAS